MDNWLAKLASEQPTTAENLEQALGELSLPELQELAQEQAATPNLDNLQQKVAEADQMGRELAQQQGPSLAHQAEQRALQNHAVVQSIQNLPDDEAIKLAYILEHGTDQEKQAGLASIAAKGLGAVKNMAGKAISSGAGQKALHWSARNPQAAAAIGGGAAGGAHSKVTGGSFLGGAAFGAGMGAGGAHLADKGKVTGMLGKASKWGKGQVKAASAPRFAGKALARRIGVEGGAVGAGIGGVGLGAVGGLGAAKLMDRPSGFGAEVLRGFIDRAGEAAAKPYKKTASPLSGAVSAMAAHDLSKLAYLNDNKNEWLEQFEGTPLLPQAVSMVQEELQTEIDSIEQRKQEDEHRREMDTGPSSYHEKDMLRAKKKMLELQLVAQRNGLGDPTGGGAEEPAGEPAPEAPPEGGEMPAEAAPEPGTSSMEEAQEQVKEAYALALAKQASALGAVAKGLAKKGPPPPPIPGAVKTAAMPRIRMARDVRRAAAQAAGAAKGMDKKKLLKGVAAVGTAGGVGTAVGHKKGKTKGRREGFGVGVRRGYVAGAQRGYAVGRAHSKTASFS